MYSRPFIPAEADVAYTHFSRDKMHSRRHPPSSARAHRLCGSYLPAVVSLSLSFDFIGCDRTRIEACSRVRPRFDLSAFSLLLKKMWHRSKRVASPFFPSSFLVVTSFLFFPRNVIMRARYIKRSPRYEQKVTVFASPHARSEFQINSILN